MATNTTVLFRGAATTTVGTTLYTVPSGRTAIVTNIAVTNTAGTAGTFTIGLAGTALHTTAPIAANSTAYIDLKQVLAASNTITGGASATSVNFHISGIEVF
jgi:Na+-transporting NADH:ubiquinone oxidoreductase subunit NqrA